MARSEQDMLKLVDKLFPVPGGEHDLQLRMGRVEALNPDNTIDASIGGVLLQDVKTLSSAYPYLVVDRSAVFLQWRGTLIALGSVAVSGLPEPEPVRIIGARSTKDVMLSTSSQDVTGTAMTFLTYNANAHMHVTATADFDSQAPFTSTTICVGELYIDNVVQAGQILYQIKSSDDRATVAQTWSLTIASAGSHTIKLTGRFTTATATVNMRQEHTAWSATIVDTP